jgi:hypothetical protein
MIERPQPILGRLAQTVSAPGRTVLIASAALFFLGAGSIVFSKGKTVVVTTNAANAQVRIDGRAGTQVDPTTWRFDGVPFGQRAALASHRDFIPRNHTLAVGVFSGGQFSLELERRKVRLTFKLPSGAEVFLNEQSFGKANESGVFINEHIPAGDYLVAVRLPGYEEWRRSAGLHEESNEFHPSLQMTPEKRAEVARQRDRAFQLLQEAEALFGRRNYSAALDAIQTSIRLFPEDYRALQLRDRIVETMKILK